MALQHQPRPIALFLSLVAASVLTAGCPHKQIDVTEYYVMAIRDPQGYDSWLANQSVDPRAAGCLHDHVDVALDRRDAALLECDEIFGSVSDHFHACAAERADPWEQAAAILYDIARTVEGKVRFVQTPSHFILVFAWEELGAADYHRFFVSPLEQVVAAGGGFKCGV